MEAVAFYLSRFMTFKFIVACILTYQQIISTIEKYQKMEKQMEIVSDRRIYDVQPVIGTQILDGNLPSQINFKLMPSKNVSKQNPEEICLEKNAISIDNNTIRSFRVTGKSIFNTDPLYSDEEIVKNTLKTFSVKAFDEQKSEGLRKIWESMVGFTKREIYVENGHFYVFQAVREGLQRKWSSKLNNLLHIFVDMQESTVRLVFLNEHTNKRENKNYKMDHIEDFMQKMVLQGNIVGLAITEQQI